MNDKKNQEEKEDLKSKIEELQSKLDSIEQGQQQKSKFQLWLGKIGLVFLLGAGLKSSMQQLYSELPANVKRDTLADVTTNVIWRFTRIGLFGLLIALIPTVLLWQQNKLLKNQNDLFAFQNIRVEQQTKLLEKQNEKIDNQIQLEESNRRGALIVMMSNIMDKVDEELTRDWNNDGKRNLSPQLIGRISALSQSFRPYRFWQDSMLIEKPLSPERGQLLLALVNSDLDSLAYRDIYKEATFQQAYLESANLRDANLNNAHLNNAHLNNAHLNNANLNNTYLWNANLKGVHLGNANLNNAHLGNANLKGADLDNANLNNAYLSDAILRYANLECTDLNNAYLWGADLRNTHLKNALLFNANLGYADLRNTNLTKTFLNNTYLVHADLRNTDLRNDDLKNVILTKDLVYEQESIYKLEAPKIKKVSKSILEKNHIDRIIYPPKKEYIED